MGNATNRSSPISIRCSEPPAVGRPNRQLESESEFDPDTDPDHDSSPGFDSDIDSDINSDLESCLEPDTESEPGPKRGRPPGKRPGSSCGQGKRTSQPELSTKQGASMPELTLKDDWFDGNTYPAEYYQHGLKTFREED